MIASLTRKEANDRQEAWAKHLKTPISRDNTIDMKFRMIPPGEFLQGAPESDTFADDAEKPQHRVTITRPFLMGKFEVTVGQFRKFVEETKYRTFAESTGKGSVGIDRKLKNRDETGVDLEDTGSPWFRFSSCCASDVQ